MSELEQMKRTLNSLHAILVTLMRISGVTSLRLPMSEFNAAGPTQLRWRKVDEHSLEVAIISEDAQVVEEIEKWLNE